MAGRVGLRHEAAEGVAQHDRPDDPERVAECPDVIAPLRQIPGFGIGVSAAAVATVVKIDELRHVAQRPEGWLEHAVVAARAAVQ